MSACTADPSAGEFTRGMEILARGPDDSGASSQAAAIQDDYLMKLLSGRPSSAAPSLQLAAKQLAASVVALAPAPGIGGSSGHQHAAAKKPLAGGGQQKRVAASPGCGSSAAARAGLGPQRFAKVRVRLLLDQDVFLQQMFDLHRCVRRQQQLVAVCDRPDALHAALAALLASSQPALPSGSLGDCSAPVVAAPAATVVSAEQHTAVHRAPWPSALPHALAQPLPGSFPYRPTATTCRQPGHTSQVVSLATAAPAHFDPMVAWYTQHYGAPPPPYACAAAASPLFSHHPAVGIYNAAHGPAGGLYGGAGFAAASPDRAMPQSSAPAGVSPGAAAFPARPLALPHGDRWWQDPAQVFGPAGVPALVERALTLQQAQSGGQGGTACTRRGNEAQSHLQAKAKTLMHSESMPLKKRSFESTHDDCERAGTASGSNSPGGHGSSQPTHAPKLSQAAKRARKKPASKRRGNSSSSGVCDRPGKGSVSSGAHGPRPGALQTAASVLLSFSAMTD